MDNNKTEMFIEKARAIYGNKYDYSRVEYVNSHTKVCIICPEHGEFWQTPNNHLNGHNCYMCGKGKKTTSDFIKDAILVHGNKYDYSETSYDSANKKVAVNCKIHGKFFIRASSHLNGCGCKKCASEESRESQRKTAEEFINKSIEVHGRKYDYSKIEYVNSYTKVCIICPEHGEFWQTPNAHIKLFEGCPQCKNSRMHEFLSNIFAKDSIMFEKEKTFDWLKFENNMFIDFYLPDYNIAIECQGGQHFLPIKKFGGNIDYEKRVKRDIEKNKLCLEHGLKLIYIIPRRYKSYIGNGIYNENNSLIFESKDLMNNIIKK